MIKIDDPEENNKLFIFYANCLTCNDPSDTVSNILTTYDKYKAMIAANNHIRMFGYGHSINITYSEPF